MRENKATLVFATHNRHKLQEIRSILDENFIIRGLDDIGCREDIPENKPSIEENALEKARYVYRKYHFDCFADDTGLEVSALDNEPGVYSARYAGEPSDPAKNISKLLGKLAGITYRKARFRTVIALIINGEEYLFEGIVNGEIIQEKKGSDGFGYDPVFIPDGYSQTFAEMTAEKKNSISHRGMAVKKLIDFLEKTKNY
ncbi:MAG: non-canonical purine NTP diphosphatase [Bacteroidota bacterium]